MALADYRLCDLCEAKAFYDSNFDYDFKEYPDTGLSGTGDWAVLCRECAKTHQVKIEPKAPRAAPDAPPVTSELEAAHARIAELMEAVVRLRDRATDPTEQRGSVAR